jgi:hypothetical protein
MRFRGWNLLLCLCTALGTASGVAQAERPPRDAPVGAPLTDFSSALRQTAAVVDGIVSDISSSYSEEEGPWTTITLSNVRVRFGSAPQTVRIRQFGGPLPDGTNLAVAELPSFAKGERYVVFLRNTTWSITPLVIELTMRIFKSGTREMLVDNGGIAVTRIGSQGPDWGEKIAPQIFETLSEDLAEGLERAAEGSGALDVNDLDGLIRAEMVSAKVSVGGKFYDEPSGAFNWRSIRGRPAR